MRYVYRYSQGRDPRWTASDTLDSTANTVQGATTLSLGGHRGAKWTPTVTSGGACQGISSWWLIKRALDTDFWDWFGAPKVAAPDSPRTNGTAGEPMQVIKEVMLAQSKMGKAFGNRWSRSANHSAAINYILAKTGGHLTNKRGLVVRQNQPWKNLGYEVIVAKGYCFIGFSRANWGGHAIAAHICGDGSVEIMDPNFGECEFPDLSSFVNWMGERFPAIYGFDKVDTFELQTLSRPGQ